MDLDIRRELLELTGFLNPTCGDDFIETGEKETLNDKGDEPYTSHQKQWHPADEQFLPTSFRALQQTQRSEYPSDDEVRVTKTIMGVIPSRETLKIGHLNVLMEGTNIGSRGQKKTPHPSAESKTGKGVLEGKKPPVKPVSRPNMTGSRERKDQLISSRTAKLEKPAILPSRGTTATIKFSDRIALPSRTVSQMSSKSKFLDATDKSTARTSKTVSKTLGTDGKGSSHSSKRGSGKLVRDLEAHEQEDAVGDLDSYYDVDEDEVAWKGERTVDEIIADLRKSQQEKEIRRKKEDKSETDVKIASVIERIKFRGNEMGLNFSVEVEEEEEDDDDIKSDAGVNSDDGISTGRASTAENAVADKDAKSIEEKMFDEIMSPYTTFDLPGQPAADGLSLEEMFAESKKEPLEVALMSDAGSRSELAGFSSNKSIWDSEHLDRNTDDKIQKALEDLKLNPNVTVVDVLNIRGSKQKIHLKAFPSTKVAAENKLNDSRVTIENSMASERENAESNIDKFKSNTSNISGASRYPSIHQFCVTGDVSDDKVPFFLQPLSTALHAPSMLRNPHTFLSSVKGQVSEGDHVNSPKPSTLKDAKDSIQNIADSIFEDYLNYSNEADEGGLGSNKFEKLQKLAQAVVQPLESLELEGSKITFADLGTMQLWKTAAPKMNLTPGYIQQKLFSQFNSAIQGTTVDGVIRSAFGGSSTNQWKTFDFEDDEDMSQNGAALDNTGILRETKSESNLYLAEREERDHKLTAAAERDLELKTNWLTQVAEKEEEFRRVAKESMLAGKKLPEKEPVPVPLIGPFAHWSGGEGWDELVWQAQRKGARRFSHPSLTLQVEHEGYRLPTDVNTYIEETKLHRERALKQLHDKEVQKHKHQFNPVQGEKEPEQPDGVEKQLMSDEEVKPMAAVQTAKDNVNIAQNSKRVQSADLETASSPPLTMSVASSKKAPKVSRAERSLQSALNYGNTSSSSGVKKLNKKGQGQQQTAAQFKLTRVGTLLSKPVRHLERSRSAELKKVPLKPKSLKVASKVKQERRRSLPREIEETFEMFLAKQGYNENTDPELEDPYDFALNIWYQWFDEKYPPAFQTKEDVITKAIESAVTSQVINDKDPIDLNTLDTIEHNIENAELIESIENKIAELTERIGQKAKTMTYDLVQRAALQRKLGRIKEAWADVNEALSREENYLEAYWHRHFLFLVQGQPHSALEDLQAVIKLNKGHAGAFRSRGDIYRSMGDSAMAVVNYSQAIKLDTSDYMAYYNRGETYRERGELLLANEDYATASKLHPTLTDAKFKHGLYYFNAENWQAAVYDFNEIVRMDASHADARLYRGRCFLKLGNWSRALEDLSAAVHLSPNDPTPFYYRACLLRKQYPRMALQDFSVSLLLDDSYDNRFSFLHRGILYMGLDRYEDALLDFASVLQLDKSMACAHCNMGVIHLTKTEYFDRAVKHFSEAIKSDPSYTRAYICRAQAYESMKNYKMAFVDFTKAIHMNPTNHHLWAYRGNVLLKMGKTEQAAFTVKQCALIADTGKISLQQQSLIYSFLKEHKKTVTALTQTARIKPTGQVLTLLGKAQMKAGSLHDAIRTFNLALEVMIPFHHKAKIPKETADVYLSLGMSHLEVGQAPEALVALNQAINIKPKNPEAYHVRGIVRVRLKQMKAAIFDLNKCLLQAPHMWQAYLSRACYYGMKGRFSKAILSCNEAIKLTKDNIRAYLYRGAFKFLSKDYEHALEDLQQAINIDSGCSQAFFNQAVCFHTIRRHEEALKSYSVALLLDEDLRQKVFINRGLLYFQIEDFNNALLDFYDAFRTNPQGSSIGHTLGLCYHKQKQYQRAIEAYSEAIESNKFFIDAYIGRGNVYMDLGTQYGFTMAKRDYSKALMLKPDCLYARVNLAYNLQVVGKMQQAWAQFAIAIGQNPRYIPALEGRAIVNLQMGQAFAALQDLGAAIKVKPSAELLTNRGVVHQFLRDFPNAMQSYQAAVRVDPTYSLAYFNGANLYFRNRQMQQAKDYFDQAVRFNRKDEAALLNRAICKVLLRDPEGALKDFGASIELNKYSSHSYFNRGNLFTSLRKYEEAEQDYTSALTMNPSDPLALKRRADVRGKLGKRALAIEDYSRAIDIQIKLENLDLVPNATAL